MMASAALPQWPACASAKAAGKPATMRSTGKFSMITPVENGSTCEGCKPKSGAKAWQVAWASCKPCAPVPALALPVLMSNARTCAPLAKCAWQTCTGAAQNRFFVKTPATVLPASNKIRVKSLRPTLRMPACAMPKRTPGTGHNLAGSGALKLTVMTVRPAGLGFADYANLPWQCLYFFPLPQGQGSLRPTGAIKLLWNWGCVCCCPVSSGAV